MRRASRVSSPRAWLIRCLFLEPLASPFSFAIARSLPRVQVRRSWNFLCSSRSPNASRRGLKHSRSRCASQMCGARPPSALLKPHLERACKLSIRGHGYPCRVLLKCAFANFFPDVRNGWLTTFFARTAPEILASTCPSYMVQPFCSFPWLKSVRVSPASSPPAQTVLIPRHNSVPFRLPARRIVVPVRPSRLQKMSVIILDETRMRSSPRGILRERTAAQGCALITTRLHSAHSVRGVEGRPCVPPLPPQVPRTVEIDVSVATATFLLFFESLEVCGAPI